MRALCFPSGWPLEFQWQAGIQWRRSSPDECGLMAMTLVLLLGGITGFAALAAFVVLCERI